jgi:LysR family nitrogen assimilation transcriptional regulator
MDLKQLEYFRHVAEFGSFTRAAAFLSVVQPALSRQIRQLELECGQSLLDRNGRGVTLTEAGTQLLEHARGILTQLGRAQQELNDRRNGDTGHLTLGLPPSLGSNVTVPLVKAFRENMPNARLATAEGLSAYILEWLNSGRVDCALVYNAANQAAFESVPVVDEQLFLITPRSARRKESASITLAQLADYPLVIPNRPHTMRMAVEHALAEVDRKIQVAHEIESIPAIIDLVRQGHGFAVLPINAVRSTPWSEDVLAKPILAPTFTISLSMVTSSLRPKSRFMRNAMKLVCDTVRKEIHSKQAAPRPNAAKLSA